MRPYLIFIPCLVLANNHPQASPIEVLETYTEAFEPHGTLEIEGSYGALIIEGSSNTNVRLKLEKKTIKDYNLADHDHLKKDIDQTLVRFERMSPGYLRLQTKLPSFNLLKRPLQGRSNLNLIYYLTVPRDTKLVIRHDVGLVTIREVIGQLDVKSNAGEVEVSLSDSHNSSIHASTRIGDVESDFHPEVKRNSSTGAELNDNSGRPRHRVDLQVGVGAIKITRQRPETI